MTFSFVAWAAAAAWLAVLLFFFLALDWEAVASRLSRLRRGARRRGGYLPRSVFTGMKARGTRTPETATTEGCSSPSRPGGQSEGQGVPTWLALANSYSGHGLSGFGTADHSARIISGRTLLGPAGYGDTQ